MQFNDAPPPLPDEVLARIPALPRKPDAVRLVGKHIILEPTDPDRDAEELFAASNGQPLTIGNRHVDAYDADRLIWRWLFVGPFASSESLRASLQQMVDLPDWRCFTVRDKATGHAVGSTSLIANVPKDLKIEIGMVWFGPIAQRTGANTEATYLLLKHAFELGYLRVEWKCDALNERSRLTAQKLGFTYEGTQDNHMIIKNRVRHTAWFRMLWHEWPSIKPRLEAMIEERR